MRLLLSGAAIIALILAVSVGASASPHDVVGTPYQGSVDELAALGVLTGFPDGTFRPDSPITRAQLAAATTRALGLDTTALLERGATLFPDVQAVHWASGYVNVCVDRGVLRGYPDGTFRPEQPVSHAEFLAILIRVLGYEPIATGPWPDRYLSQALELGLIEHDAFDPHAAASRGDVALGFSRALAIRVLEPVSATGAPYTLSVTLGEKSFGLVPVQGLITVTAQVFTPGLSPGSIVVRSNGADREYQLAEGIGSQELLGREVLGWRDGDILTAIRILTQPDRLTTGVVTGWHSGGRLRFGDKWYDLAASPTIYLNRVADSGADLTGAEATLTLDDDGRVLLIDAFRWQGTWLVNNVSGDEFRPRDEQGQLAGRIRSSAYQRIVIVRNGQQAWFDDLEPGDVVRYAEVTDALYLSVSDRVITGVLSEAVSHGGGRYSLDIGGLTLTTDGLTLSPDGNDFTFLAASAREVQRFSGVVVNAHLDHSETVRHLSARVPPAETRWGLVLTPPAGGELEVALSTGRTEVRRYGDSTVWQTLTGSNAGVPSEGPADIAVGDIVCIDLGPDETVVSVVEPVLSRVDPAEWIVDAANRLIRSRSLTGHATADTSLFDLSSGRVIPWASFCLLSPGPDSAGRWLVDDGELQVLAVEGMQSDSGLTLTSGVVIARVITADGPSIRVLSGTRQVEYRFTDDTLITARQGANDGQQVDQRTALDVGDFILFSSAADGTLHWITEPAADSLSGYVTQYDAANGILTLQRVAAGDGLELVTVIVRRDAPVYDCLDDVWPAGPQALAEGVFVQVFCSQPGVVDAIKIIR